jgi:tetratricopeptide (TPR) repeat protein
MPRPILPKEWMNRLNPPGSDGETLLNMATVGTLSSSEEAQLTQTIEMFEVITQSQPQDYQSLEILREAYVKLGREMDVINTSKRIANAYVLMGQLSSAILEYESILQKYPDDPDALAALAEIESKAGGLNANATSPAATDQAEIVKGPAKPAKSGNTTHSSRKQSINPDDIDDGRKPLQKLFLDSKVIAPTDFETCWPRQDFSVTPSKIIDPFIQTLADKGILPVEKSLKVILDKHRIAYVPIDRYDVDIELARTFPQAALKRWCILPFDRMSKSILVATANPFSKQAALDLEETTKQRIIWYLVNPTELLKVLRKVIR